MHHILHSLSYIYMITYIYNHMYNHIHIYTHDIMDIHISLVAPGRGQGAHVCDIRRVADLRWDGVFW